MAHKKKAHMKKKMSEKMDKGSLKNDSKMPMPKMNMIKKAGRGR